MQKIICISNNNELGFNSGKSNYKNGTYDKINSSMGNDIIMNIKNIYLITMVLNLAAK